MPWLTENEIEEQRTPTRLYEWCREKIEKIADEGGTYDLRMRRGLCKELLEEVYPIAIWAYSSKDVSNDAIVAPKLGSQPYDGTVIDEQLTPSEYYIEVTQEGNELYGRASAND